MLIKTINSPSKLPTPSPPPPNLPPAQPNLQPHPHHPSHTYPPAITHRHRPETKLPILPPHAIADLRERVHIHRPPQQALPENNREHHPHGGEEVEQGLRDEDREIQPLQHGGDVEPVDAEEGRGGAGDEDPGLVDGVVDGVEGAVVREGGGGEGEEEHGRHALVYRVFGYVD